MQARFAIMAARFSFKHFLNFCRGFS